MAKKYKTYDIRTPEHAQQTLINLTGIAISVWKQYLGQVDKYRYTDDLVKDVIDSHGDMPCSYRDLEFIYFHITTSADECISFQRHGVLDLKKSYLCPDSELRKFLEKHDIHIDLDEGIMIHDSKRFDITFGECPGKDTEAYKRWLIGRKFFDDYTTCGFLSAIENKPYGGEVHRRPEILWDIDSLLGLNLPGKWTEDHKPYEIVARVNGDKVFYDGYDYPSDKDRVLYYLRKAYCKAFEFEGSCEEIIRIKNGVKIPPSDILEIKPMTRWKND